MALILYAINNEINRNEIQLKSSISGLIKATPAVESSIIKTDSAYVMLFKPNSSMPIAVKVINPFLTPTSFQIGQESANETLEGEFRILIFTDKDGNPETPSIGESSGELMEPILIGTEKVVYTLNQRYKGLTKEITEITRNEISQNIQGVVNVEKKYINKIKPSDRLIIMLFDPKIIRPVAIRILSKFTLPQKFSIGVSDTFDGNFIEGPFSLRILTDNNMKPFVSNKGELIGRSKNLIDLGNNKISFFLDEEYNR